MTPPLCCKQKEAKYNPNSKVGIVYANKCMPLVANQRQLIYCVQIEARQRQSQTIPSMCLGDCLEECLHSDGQSTRHLFVNLWLEHYDIQNRNPTAMALPWHCCDAVMALLWHNQGAAMAYTRKLWLLTFGMAFVSGAPFKAHMQQAR